MSKRLLVSFSGGRTSAFMTHWILENWKGEWDDIRVVFANTGQERDETLRFVAQCDEYFGMNLVWVEADVSPGFGNGTTHRVVDYATASRDGRPFEDMCAKYGIPNVSRPICTRELKLRPITSYLRSEGWTPGGYHTAIGIRRDEMDRVSAHMVRDKLIYPVCEDVPMSKEGINEWWRHRPFNLRLREQEGNCSWCWKKSKRKLLTLAKDSPELFEFPARMEREYGLSGLGATPKARKFFRGHQGALDVLETSRAPFIPFEDTLRDFDEDMDAAGGCSESCEMH